ncbi:MAG: hypothetical protein V7L23_13065 [Nostoc sp.]|uniref:hypothetical protein n=1 Tax=Nostoc sp. TaxID=1180 RepID=UPI002FEEE57E
MHIRKKPPLKGGGFTNLKKIVYAPNNEFCHCLQILAAIQNKSVSLYALDTCKQWIPALSISHFRTKQATGRRENPINVYIDKELDELMKKFEKIPQSNIFEKCLALEVQAQASKWGCQSPQHFIELMTSYAPLELLGLSDDIQVAA